MTVVNMGHGDVRDKALAGCAAGGTDLPDVVTIENSEAEVYWARFPDCFTNLKEFGVEKYKDAFAPFKWAELSAGDAIYSLPWDSGPAVVFYRRDLYEQAGVDPASIKTWDDFIEAGKKILAATDGKVKMGTINLSDDDAWFRPLANQQGCSYFDPEGETITINQPGCVNALEILKKMNDAGLLALGDWGAQIQNVKTGAVAGSLYGGWYEGTIRSNAPELEGKWGVYEMPAATEGRRARGELGRLVAGHHLGVEEQGSRLGLYRICAGHQRRPDLDAEEPRACSIAPLLARGPLRQGAAALLGRPGDLGRHPGDHEQDPALSRHAVLPGDPLAPS